MLITLYTFMREREREREREEKIGGEEDRVLLYHIYSFTDKQLYFNHMEEKR